MVGICEESRWIVVGMTGSGMWPDSMLSSGQELG
jgi:hypothetical protein